MYKVIVSIGLIQIVKLKSLQSLVMHIPALLTECMMYAIKLRATNRTFDSDNVIQIANAKSIVGTNGIKLFELFKGRLASEVIADFTFNGMETYDLDIDADILSNIRIGISLNGGPMCYYDTPAYCDSLLTPLITTKFLISCKACRMTLNELPIMPKKQLLT